jgi:hypothetical protein
VKPKKSKTLTDEAYKERKRQQRERRNVKKHKQASVTTSKKTKDTENDTDDYNGPTHVSGLTFKVNTIEY